MRAGQGVGGVWFWNRYPGARCDVESVQYAYSFDDGLQQEWTGAERLAPQGEILGYRNHIADPFDLRRDIQFEARVTAVHYDETANLGRANRRRRAAFRGCVPQQPGDKPLDRSPAGLARCNGVSAQLKQVAA